MSRPITSLDSPECVHGWAYFNPAPCPRCEWTSSEIDLKDYWPGSDRWWPLTYMWGKDVADMLGDFS